MKSTQSSGVWDTLLIVAVAALAVTFSHATQAVADEATVEERIVDISPDGNGDQNQSGDQAVDEAPLYWLGIEGGTLDSDVLRTHLQLAGDVGVVVRAVSPKSPAEKAGLRAHDIVIGVGGEQVTGMETLQTAVQNSNAKPLELKVIRLAKEMTVAVTPEPMPKELAESQNAGGGGGFNFNFQDVPMGELNDVLKEFQIGAGGGMRIVGPGMIVRGQAFDARNLPDGVSLSITRENDGPAKITVKKGDETWNVEGNDEEALKKLPDDIRPLVEQMLGGQQGPGPFIKQFKMGQGGGGFALPPNLGQNVEQARQRAEEASQRIMKQMEQMEKQMEAMQRRFDEQFPGKDANPAGDPSKT